MSKTIWIIKGETGEYDDYTTWLVKAFNDNTKAQDYLSQLIKLMALLSLDRKQLTGSGYYNRIEKGSASMKQLDPNFIIDYTGTTYSIVSMEIE